MRKYILPLIILAFSAPWLSVAQNALSFDNVDDEVVVPSASALINGSTAISMTCWVMLENGNIAWPDYDGILGFRNDATADFYLIQHAQTRVEARFRNSGGTAFTLVDSNLVTGVWYHYALVYDGMNLSLYRDATLKGIIPANGSINSSTVNFNLGAMPYFTTTNFRLLGKIDEASLWNTALTPAEVFCGYSSGFSPQATGLVLYYKCDQGVAGGNNSGITTLTDASGHIDGNLNNFALNGPTSNFVAGVTGAGSTVINATICQGETYSFNGQSLSTAGTYNVTFTSSAGCDSVVTLNLTVKTVNISVTVAGVTMTATQGNAAYQWLNCNNNYAPIGGATSQSYTPTANGLYAVAITYDGCTDTSNCIPITTVGLGETSGLSGIMLSPIPAGDKLTIEFPVQTTEIRLTLFDLGGREILTLTPSDGSRLEVALDGIEPGCYLMRIQTRQGTHVAKVLLK